MLAPHPCVIIAQVLFSHTGRCIANYILAVLRSEELAEELPSNKPCYCVVSYQLVRPSHLSRWAQPLPSNALRLTI